MNQSEALRLVIEALQGIQEALEEQNKLINSVIGVPNNPAYPPRVLAEVLGTITTIPDY